MILGQLRMGARQAKSAPLITYIPTRKKGHSRNSKESVDQKMAGLRSICSNCQRFLEQEDENEAKLLLLPDFLGICTALLQT